MSTEPELSNDELDIVSGGAGVSVQCSTNDLACALASVVAGVISGGSGGSGGGLVHEPIHAN